jgi:hypothetical protein
MPRFVVLICGPIFRLQSQQQFRQDANNKNKHFSTQETLMAPAKSRCLESNPLNEDGYFRG